MNSQLEPPTLPFAPNTSARLGSPRTESPLLRPPSTHSLSINYLPTKFSDAVLYNGLKNRGKGLHLGPKLGGGREAFRSGEARMPGEGDEDYDGVQGSFFGKEGGRTRPRLRWNKFKWTLFVSNLLVSFFLSLSIQLSLFPIASRWRDIVFWGRLLIAYFYLWFPSLQFSGYSLAGTIFLLCTWFDVWKHADVVRVGNRDELIVSTIAAAFGIITSVIGWAGILLNNRSFLAVYTFFLWICFALLVTPGYITFKRRNFNLDGKINSQWGQDFGISEWLRIQNQLRCCGFFSPFVEAAISQVCFSRSVLPGCKGPYMDFERLVLKRWYTVVFGLVPFQIAIILVGLLCSNHITYRFGKGMMPKAYRLSMNSMAVIMDNYARYAFSPSLAKYLAQRATSQLAEQYGEDVASDVLARSRSNLQIDALPVEPYASGTQANSFNTFSTKQDSFRRAT